MNLRVKGAGLMLAALMTACGGGGVDVQVSVPTETPPPVGATPNPTPAPGGTPAPSPGTPAPTPGTPVPTPTAAPTAAPTPAPTSSPTRTPTPAPTTTPAPSPTPTPTSTAMPTQPNNPKAQSGKYAYGEALQKALLFFEINRSGTMPASKRIEWRGNSSTTDGSDVSLDLAGGYHDAGGHVKFALPTTFSITTLAWSVMQYRDSYISLGQYDEALAAIKWGTDYLLKTHRTANNQTSELYVQVGNITNDGNYWGPPEQMTMARPAYKVTPTKPGSDIAMDTAAAMAAASIVLRPYYAAHANTLLNNARQLHAFAEQYPGKYSDSVPEVKPNYPSSNEKDELAWGSIWLYRATGESGFLTKAKSYYDANPGIGDWTYSIDDKSYGTAVLLAQIEPTGKYAAQVRTWLDYWLNGTTNIKYTSGGFAWRALSSSGLNAATVFLAQMFYDTVSLDSRYLDFSTKQVNYLLGDNPSGFSYMVGFGSKYPQRVRHRACHGAAGWNNYPSTNPNGYVCWGALVGGLQSANDADYSDVRDNPNGNEAAINFNAPFVGALVALYTRLGGPALTDAQLSNLPGIR
jgi:endoglucanase